MVNNFININIDNFNVTDAGTAWDIARSLDEGDGINDENPNDGNLL